MHHPLSLAECTGNLDIQRLLLDKMGLGKKAGTLSPNKVEKYREMTGWFWYDPETYYELLNWT